MIVQNLSNVKILISTRGIEQTCGPTCPFKIAEHIKNATEIFAGDLSAYKILVAFSVSAALNLIYAPVMMTLHKLTDIHIVANGGKLTCLLRKIHFAENFKQINWDVQWHFIYKKTIPLFWIPAHTITFLLPAETQVLFAALLGIALGAILAFASLKK